MFAVAVVDVGLDEGSSVMMVVLFVTLPALSLAMRTQRTLVISLGGVALLSGGVGVSGAVS